MKITSPTLLLDENKCRKNISRMTEKARINNLIFRPHFKTHQSATIAEWFKEEGISKITVSSVTMAEYFVKAGWEDILIAFPANILEFENINFLSKTIKLSLTLESNEAAEFLANNLIHETGIYIKIDTGYHRTGITWNDFEQIQSLIEDIKLTDKMRFSGFMVHPGHTYQAQNPGEIIQIYNDTLKKLIQLKKQFSIPSFSPLISLGDTPSCSVVGDFGEADEIRPGNFVFYDVMQSELGSCSINDIAVALACPVVALHKLRNEFVIYGGAIQLSKEFILDSKGNRMFGKIVKFSDAGWTAPLSDTFVKSLSQEHGIIKTTEEILSQIKIGDLIGILPVHSCLTAHQMNRYLTMDGKLIQMMNGHGKIL